MRLLSLLFCTLVAAQGCIARRSAAQAGSELSSDRLAQLRAIANDFWSAAARQDSAGMMKLASSAKPLRWAQGQREAFPAFFATTNGKLRPLHGYYLTAKADTAIIEVQVPWRTCQPPVHTGAEDHYFVMFTPVGNRWRISNIWSDPC